MFAQSTQTGHGQPAPLDKNMNMSQCTVNDFTLTTLRANLPTVKLSKALYSKIVFHSLTENMS